MNMIRLVVQGTNKDFCCYLAETDIEKADGLTHWGQLPQGAGLLFAMPVATDVQFWMSGVRFPIDIIMLDENAIVKKVFHNCQPGSQDRYSAFEIRWVLEVKAGECVRAGITEGVALRAIAAPYEFNALVRPELLAMHAAYNATLEGNQSYGAVLALGVTPIGWGWNKTATSNNPTHHAEMMAISDATMRGSDVTGAEMYSTHMPCMMCGAALTWCKIPRVSYLLNSNHTTLARIADDTRGPIPVFKQYNM